MIKTRSARHRVNQDAYAVMVAHLVTWPADVAKLAELSGLTLRCVQEFMRSLHRRGGVYVVKWRKDPRGAPRTPVFALKLKSTDRDAEKQLKSRYEIDRDYRERKKAAAAALAQPASVRRAVAPRAASSPPG